MFAFSLRLSAAIAPQGRLTIPRRVGRDNRGV